MNSVLMTVFNREYEVLLCTLRSLARSLGPEDEVIVVDDGSTIPYDGIRAYGEKYFGDRFRWISSDPYEAFRIGDGFNNPARAFNIGLAEAKFCRLFAMSSDVIVTPNAVQRANRTNFEEMAWTPMVIDFDGSFNLPHYCGPMRLFPAPWFLGCSTRIVKEIGGWDENYLQGVCYEDNDFIGRLMLKTKRFIGDWNSTVYHQSHVQPAYLVENPEIKEANDKNRLYTKWKWSGGIPFAGGEDACFDVLRKPYVTGDIVHECKFFGTLLDDTIRRTNSPFNKEYVMEQRQTQENKDQTHNPGGFGPKSEVSA